MASNKQPENSGDELLIHEEVEIEYSAIEPEGEVPNASSTPMARRRIAEEVNKPQESPMEILEAIKRNADQNEKTTELLNSLATKFLEITSNMADLEKNRCQKLEMKMRK